MATGTEVWGSLCLNIENILFKKYLFCCVSKREEISFSILAQRPEQKPHPVKLDGVAA